MTIDEVRRAVWYRGRVQGVGFRYTACRLADGFAVAGFVENLPDGRVHLVAEGAAAEVDRYLTAVAAELARNIVGRETETAAATGEFDGFEIRR